MLDNNVLFLTKNIMEPSELEVELNRMNSKWYPENKVVGTDIVSSYHWGKVPVYRVEHKDDFKVIIHFGLVDYPILDLKNATIFQKVIHHVKQAVMQTSNLSKAHKCALRSLQQ